MDTKKLSSTYPQLISYMKSNGYSHDYIKTITIYIHKVISLDGNNHIKSYEDLFTSMDSVHGYSESYDALRARRCFIGLIRDFDLYGIFPDRRTRSFFMHKKSYLKLNDHYKELINVYKGHAEQTNKRRETIATEISNGSCFFLHLMNSGANTIETATSDQIISFFYDGHTIIRGHSYRKNVKAILIGNKDGQYAQACTKVIDLLPYTSVVKKNFPFLNDKEAELLHNYIMDDNNGEMLRDKLITALAFFYGLRGSDIARFSYDWIDWNNAQIVIIQSKTGEKLILPLLTSIGNMIVDYVRLNPNKKGTTPMFTSLNCGCQLAYKTIGNIVTRFMKRAGIRVEDGMTGVRVLRHHVATLMLRKGVKAPIISSILGHISPESVVPYIDCSIEDLQSCALDISMYPVENKIFDL